MLRPELLAVDWGTSALRGALLAAEGAVLDQVESDRGLLSIPTGGWPGVFDELFGNWRRAHPGLPCLMAGMVGSRQGWQEAPYCACPASLDDLAAQVRWLPPAAGQAGLPGRIGIVPGLSFDAAGLPDVMRGEETQVFGALQGLGGGRDTSQVDAAPITVVLPGTHSKWVRVQAGRITGLATHMTGECYALLRQHSLLARGLPADDSAWDAEAFDAGIAQAQTPGGLLHHLFSIRSLGLFDRAEPAALASRLSGLVIGEELRAQLPMLAAGQALLLVGSELLTQRYQRGLARLGWAANCADAQATWRGLAAIARRALSSRVVASRLVDSLPGAAAGTLGA